MSTKHGAHWLDREDQGDVTVVRLKIPQAPDEDTIRTIFDLIYTLVSDVGRNKLVLNLAAADFLPSMAIGKLVMLNRKIQAAKGRLALCALTAHVHENLEHTRLLPLFIIYTNESDAVASLNQPQNPEEG